MLARWSPFNGGIVRSSSPMPALDELFREADNLFRSAIFNDLAPVKGTWSAATPFLPAADVLENAQEIQVRVDLPGHDPKDLQVKVEDGTLSIQSERKQEQGRPEGDYLRSERSYGAFARSFALPATVDPSKVEARYENGVLTVTLPKREEAKPKKITVAVK
jgi:HSP20 family protein